MIPILRTERLTLRPLRNADVPALVHHLAEWSVMRWLSAPPWPYTLKDAHWFVDQNNPDHWAIESNGKLAGVIALDPALGYWLAKDLHGNGLMSEAVESVLDHRFAASSDPVVSGHKLDNNASRAVLLKHGFTDTHVEPLLSRPLGREVQVQRMELSANNWHSLRTAAQ